MPEETQVVETKETPLDQASMADYKKARAEGKEAVVEEVSTTKTEEQKTAEEEKPKVKGGFQKRIDRLVKHAATLEQQLADRNKAFDDLESKLKGKTEGAQEQVLSGAEPKREQFNSDAEYNRALVRWEVKQELKAEREAEEQKAVADERKGRISEYNKKAVEAQARYDDFSEVVAKNDEPIPANVGEAIIFDLENGPDVAYYLGKNTDVCKELMEMSPSQAMARIWEISKELGAEEAEEEEKPEQEAAVEEEKPKRRAPVPIRPVAGGTTRAAIPLDKTNFADYKKLRAQGRVQ